ncbi:PRC-barrel domain-containing protein [Micromonospora sp. SL4-19]|uniref:PRC-barrel domain-containing protein n=1 Tax=Micromonospora sp. SL4-19 TaxID=3399129 RepID=UPI003A4E4585
MERLDPRTTHGTPDPLAYGDQGAFAGSAPAGRFDPWRYRDDAGVTGIDLVGYKVEATDGGIGKVDRASHEVNSSYLVVDTGPWIFGKKVMLPAGTVNHVDHDERKVYVDRSKDQIKAAPEYDESTDTDPAYRDKLGGYYDDTYSSIPPGTAR